MSTLVTQPAEARTGRPAAHAILSATARDGLVLLLFWGAIFLSSSASPALLDDADATHAQAAQAMLRTGDWVTLHVDGVRYLEKAPLPYWIAALSLRVFGQNAFAIHLPLALAVLGLAALGYVWACRGFGRQTGFYTALFTLTSIGPFLFTRIFIPEALLSLLLAGGLYALQRALEPEADHSSSRRTATFALLFWLAMALAVLTKGLVAIVFLLGTAALYLSLTRRWHHWRKLRPLPGILLFVAVAGPWHVLAGLRNTGGIHGHGFFWFYFVNEHFLRFLGRRTPRDYNKLPAASYWLLHLVWLFPWSFLLPSALLTGWRVWKQRSNAYYDACKRGRGRELELSRSVPLYGMRGTLARLAGAVEYATWNFAARSVLLLLIFSAVVLVFFSFSTNQEYYTFPVYLPLLMLLAAALHSQSDASSKMLKLGSIAFAGISFVCALVLLEGLFVSRHLAASSDIGSLLAHRGVGNYTLSLSHFFDLTAASLAALRLPAWLAAITLAVGPIVVLLFAFKERVRGSVLAMACTSAAFLMAAHLALNRFAPMLSSKRFAEEIVLFASRQQVEAGTQVLILGDQAFGSSLPFYLQRPVRLVDGRSSSMLFGSTFADAPPVFVTSAELRASWGRGGRKLLFVPAEQRDNAAALLGSQPSFLLLQSSGKELLTDRPLDPAP